MRKATIVPTLAVLALAPLAAHADVTLYGKIYAEFANETFGTGAAQTEYTTLDDAQNLGRLGVKFSQDIGDGNEVFGQYEFALNAPDSTNDFTMRAAHVGVRGESLSFAMGRFDGAYKTTGGTSWDPFAFTSLALSGTGGQSNTNFGNAGFIDRAVQFALKHKQDDVRFEAILQYGADNTAASTTTPKDSVLAGVTLGVGGLEVIYAFAHDAASGDTNQKFGAKAESGATTFMAQVENVDVGGFDPGGEGQFMTGIITHAFDNWLFVTEFAKYNSDYTDGAALPVPITNSDSALITVGGRYYLAKNAWVVFGFRNTDSKIDANDSTATVMGLRYDF